MGFREHGVMLFLSKDLYLGFIKLQADKSLGRSFAGLLPFTEGLYKLGYITKEVYELHKRKYSSSLVEEIKPTIEKVKPRKKQLAKKLEYMRRQFSSVIAEWPTMKATSKIYWVKKAREFEGKIPNAKMILDLNTTKVSAK